MSAGTGTTEVGNGRPVDSLVPPVPDFLGVAVRVKNVSDLLELAQQQMQIFRAQRLVNSHSLEDRIEQGNEESDTYQERFEQLNRGVAALMDDNQDIHDELVAEALKRRKQHERELETAGNG